MFKSTAGIGQGGLPLGKNPKVQIPKPTCVREVIVQSDMAWATATLESGSVLVGYHLNKPPSKESWNGWLSTKKQEIADNKLARVVVFTEGGAPSKDQQTQLRNTVYPEWSARNISARVGIQIVTSNPIFGSLVSATVAVLRVSARALGFDRIIEFYGNIEGALEFVAIPPREWDAIKSIRDYLSQELRKS